MRVPAATYRIQFHLGFRFPDARDLVPYLDALGITDLYASPRFKARKGSSHGYDVADPWRINSELGTAEEFEELAQRLQHYQMGLLLDIVPNHMAASSENPWWLDVLENGRASAYAHYFDIDWNPPTSKAAFLQENRVLLPVLGDVYGKVLENQELALKFDDAGFWVCYYEQKWPLDPKTYGLILEHWLAALRQVQGEGAGCAELAELLEGVERLPPRTATDLDHIEERRRNSREIKRRLWQLFQGDAEARHTLEQTLLVFNGTRGAPTSFDLLDRLLSEQAYRVAYWKTAAEEINYRRFFDINELVGLRVEDPEVFEARHRRIIQDAQEGRITGVRVDHIDGMFDPAGYLYRLQTYLHGTETQPGSAPGRPGFYVVVEKILGSDETLPADWPICGTTGYDFLNALNAMYLEADGVAAMEEIYTRFTRSAVPFLEIVHAKKHLVMNELFAGEVNALGHHLGRLAALDREARDLPLSELTAALVEVTAWLPVYRTYIRSFEVSERDRQYIERALELARAHTTEEYISTASLDFLRRVLRVDPPAYAAAHRSDWLAFVLRWQQFTGPVMAKGLEDTAFYVHNSLVSLNEVGGDPQRHEPVYGVEAFHKFIRSRAAQWPYTMNATSTHDTKRSEDVRARINVLAERPKEWAAHLRRWSRWNKSHRRPVNGRLVPTPSEEVMLYQNLLGAWPLDENEVPSFRERFRGFVQKAAREAKLYTSWHRVDSEHEAALEAFVDAILTPAEENPFLTDFLRLQKKLAFYGAFHSLGQLVLKIAVPGVPDFYQGTEVWDFSLVDPDNRRPVSFAQRVQWLDELKRREKEDPTALIAELVAHWPDGRIKLFTTWRGLNFRREHRELFLEGEYLPLAGTGKAARHICAFARCFQKQWALAVAPRQLSHLTAPEQPPLGYSVWGRSLLVLPEGAPRHWRNVFTGERLTAATRHRKRTLRLSHIFMSFPVALLASDE